jgi:nucleoside-diphosphate-sugar epimerase
MKTILVTGATGYLGRNLCEQLLNENYKVLALVRQNSNTNNLEQLKGDLQVFRLTESMIEEIFAQNEIDIILNTATCYGRKSEDLNSVINANLTFPLQILNSCLKYNVKYFINTDTSLPKSLNSYSLSKKQFTEWLEFYSEKINILNIQLEYFYGPHDDDSKFITFVLKELMSGKESIDFASGKPYRDFIYIADVIDAYMKLISNLSEIVGFQNIPLGSGEAFPLRNIVKQIQDKSGFTKVVLNFGALPDRTNEVEYSCANTSYLKSIGWEPKYNLAEGLQEIINIEKLTYGTN